MSWLSSYQTLAGAAVLGVVLLMWARTAASASEPPRASALLVSPRQGESIGAWELALLAIVGAAVAIYAGVAWHIDYITYNDGAYYYGVARHMALTGRFEEPIVWHFLRPPEHIVHAPFDYWGCMTSLLLVPPLALFGATLHTAVLTMAAISAAGLVAFWYLICFALPLRYCATQLLVLLIFAFSPAMDRYRFQPESIVVAQLFLLFAVIAFCRRRFVWSLGWGFCLFLSRSDGLILYAVIFFTAVIQERRTSARAWRAVLRLALVTLVFAASYMSWSLLSFGMPAPPGQMLMPRLPSYWLVFDFVAPEQRVWTSLLDRVEPTYVAARFLQAVNALRTTRFAPAMNLWLLLAFVPLFERGRPRPPGHILVWLLCVGYFLVAWIGGPGFAPPRTPFTFAPFFVLAGGLGIDSALRRLHAWVESGVPVGRRATAAGAAVLGVCAALLLQVPMLKSFLASTSLPYQATLARLDDVLQGGTVASNVPWYIVAYSRSPTVTIPHNGEAALEAVLARYQVEWLVVFRFRRTGGGTRALLEAILDGKTDSVGRFRLEPVPAPGVRPALFRVQR